MFDWLSWLLSHQAFWFCLNLLLGLLLVGVMTVELRQGQQGRRRAGPVNRLAERQIDREAWLTEQFGESTRELGIEAWARSLIVGFRIDSAYWSQADRQVASGTGVSVN